MKKTDLTPGQLQALKALGKGPKGISRVTEYHNINAAAWRSLEAMGLARAVKQPSIGNEVVITANGRRVLQ